MRKNPLLLTDGYKTSHHKMYPKGTSLVYSNFTPRSVKYMEDEAKEIVVFGVQYTMKYVHEIFRDEFFNRKKEDVIGEAKEFLSSYLGTDYDVSHFELLHDLGYLPIIVKGIQEGKITKEKIPILTIYNTNPDFFWLPNFLETLISSLLWKPLHSASIAYAYRKIVKSYAEKTDKSNLDFVDFQCHDFSFRGMQHPDSAISSGLGFLTSFKGTDTIPVLQASKHYYNSENIGFSVPASEHAVVTAYGKVDELEAFKRIMDQYPTGIVSMVSDSFDLWKVCTEFVTILKDKILSRDGKLVIRPDSGDPVDIICGLNTSPNIVSSEQASHPSYKGVIELLWEVFGGTVNEQGYKVLDPHIGAIYGDSITITRAEEICKRLVEKGFASTNIVFGVGSYSMGYATRDSQGSAVKATYVEIEGVGREIFKDPITDDGTKKSATGLLKVVETFTNDSYGKLHHSGYQLVDKVSWEEEETGALETIYEDGKFVKTVTLDEIRAKLK